MHESVPVSLRASFFKNGLLNWPPCHRRPWLFILKEKKLSLMLSSGPSAAFPCTCLQSTSKISVLLLKQHYFKWENEGKCRIKNLKANTEKLRLVD